MNINNPEAIVSKKYAQAFLHVYNLSITYDEIKQIEAIGLALENNSMIMAFLKISLADNKDQQKTVVRCIKNFGFPESMNNLIDLISKGRRLFLLPIICHWIVVYFREKRHIVGFLVTSSQPLSSLNKEIVDQFLKTYTQSSIEVSYEIDRALIAGLRMQSKTYLWEKSIAQQLRDVQLRTMR